jgi:hypothetical protein
VQVQARRESDSGLTCAAESGGLGEVRSAPKLVGRSAAASDPAAAKRLWTLSEELTGVSFPLG